MPLLTTSILISLFAALWVWMAGWNDPRGRPWLTVLCMGLLLVLPLLSVLPKMRLDVLGSGEAAVMGNGVSAWSWLMGIWFAGMVMMLVRVTYRWWVLRIWLNDSREAQDDVWQECTRSCAVMLDLKVLPGIRVKSGLSSPVVAGLLRPMILVPPVANTWSLETRRMVLLHELGHIQRRDLWLRMVADIVCTLHWYNPLIWWMRAKLLTQCEYACDARVIEAGADRRSYISALCDVVESALQEPRPHGVAAMADHAPLKMRVNRLLGGTRVGSPWLAVVAAILTTATALGLSILRPKISHRGDEPAGRYSQVEIDLRHAANPFPGN